MAYWVGARLGRRHCSLCVITHGSLRQRPAWKACQVGLPVPFDTYHRNDQPDSVRAAAAGGAPVVVAETDRGVELLLTPDDLDACAGSIDRLVAALEQAVLGLGLAWPMRRKRTHHGELRALAVGDHLPDIELVNHNGLPWHTTPAPGRSLVLILHRHLG